MGGHMNESSSESAAWLENQLSNQAEIEIELGSLIAAASDWTEDEFEIDDFVTGLFETGQIQLSIG